MSSTDPPNPHIRKDSSGLVCLDEFLFFKMLSRRKQHVQKRKFLGTDKDPFILSVDDAIPVSSFVFCRRVLLLENNSRILLVVSCSP